MCSGILRRINRNNKFLLKVNMHKQISLLLKLVFSLLVLGVVACGPKGESGKSGKSDPLSTAASGTETQTGDTKTYTTSAYSIQYPADWSLNLEGSKEVEFQLFSPLVSSSDTFRENVNLLVQDLRGQPVKTLDQYVEISESQIVAMLTDSEILASERLRRNGREFHRVEFTARQGKFALKHVQYYFLEDTTVYALTFTCLAGEFDEHKEIGIRILDSFVL